MPEKKSQIQEIREGRAMRERRWSGRLQPFGPMPKIPDRPGVRLSPRSAAESRTEEAWGETRPGNPDQKPPDK